MKLRAPSIAVAAAAVAAAAAPPALLAAPWETSFGFTTVSARGDAILVDQKPAVFVCADLGNAAPPDEAAAAALAGRLWASGFDLVRAGFLQAPAAADAAEDAGDSAADAFVASCRALGLRVWAEVLGPSLLGPPVQDDVALVDDPSTAEAWTNAVSEALSSPATAEKLFLAAAWDPRLEVAIQRRVRAWGRAFNPRTGLRRCEDPVFAVFSFSVPWLDEMCAPDRAPLPGFFEDSLREWWGNWLYERFGSDEKAELALGAFLPGETVASNTVAFPPLDPADTNRTPAFRDEQRLFLRKLDLEHMKRVVSPFSLLGPAARLAPRLVSNSAGRSLSALSTVELPGDAAFRRKAAGPRPAVWRAAAESEFSAEAAAAAKAGAAVFSIPFAGDPPDAASDAAAVFRAGPGAASGQPSGADGLDMALYARAAGVFSAPEGTNALAAVAEFPIFGAEIRFVGGKGDEARREMESMTSSSNAAPVLVVVHVPGLGRTVKGSARWTFRMRRDEPAGSLPVELSVSDAGTGEPVPFGLLAGGAALARKSLVDGPSFSTASPDEDAEAGAKAARLPENGVFPAEVPGGSALMAFRPAPIAPAILRAAP